MAVERDREAPDQPEGGVDSEDLITRLGQLDADVDEDEDRPRQPGSAPRSAQPDRAVPPVEGVGNRKVEGAG